MLQLPGRSNVDELQGKPYLACLRHAGVFANLKVMTTHDVEKLLDMLAALTSEMAPQKRKAKMW